MSARNAIVRLTPEILPYPVKVTSNPVLAMFFILFPKTPFFNKKFRIFS